jgi:hypothetical protein
MKNIIIRTLIIIAFIAAVCGAFYLIFNGSSSNATSGEGNRPQFRQSGNLPAGGPGEGFERGGEGGASAGGLLLSLGKVAGVSVIIYVISLITNLIGKKKARPTASV